MVTLEAFSSTAPPAAAELLLELGSGETGFGGTQFGQGEMELTEYLEHTQAESGVAPLPQGRVPQTTFWILSDSTAVGMLRMRHHLNEGLRVSGGHIGYYIRPAARRQGIANQALQLALQQIRQLGVDRAMLTTSPNNLGSIRVIESNGGRLTAQVATEDGVTNQYWIELSA